jgi:hypothetical protein
VVLVVAARGADDQGGGKMMQTSFQPAVILAAADPPRGRPVRQAQETVENPWNETCEQFHLPARRDEEVGRAPRPRSNEASREKGRSPQGPPIPCLGEAPIHQPAASPDFALQGFSTVS